MVRASVYIFLILTFLRHQCYGGLWSEVRDQHILLYNAYALNNDAYVDTIPRSNQNSPIDVVLSFHLYAMAEFDAVSGSIELMGSLSMKWTDEIATLKPVTFDPTVIDEIVVDYSKLWTPVIVHMNSAESIERIGDENYKVRYNLANGETTWAPRMILRSACTPDVTFFPFDEQTCTLTFAPWFSDETMIRLLVNSDTWDTSQFAGSGVWKVKSTETRAYKSGDYYYVDFTITIIRAPVYFTVNIVLPVLLLSLLSGFVFLLPAASGERVGFAITCFLSFVVLLQTMMKFLPEASAPMSLFCYYVIVMMLFTGFVCIVTTLLLRIHHKAAHGEVWRWLVHMIEIITCVKCKRMKCKKTTVEDISQGSSSSNSSQIIESDGQSKVRRWLVHVIDIITCGKCKRMKCKKNTVEDNSEAGSSSNSSQFIETHDQSTARRWLVHVIDVITCGKCKRMKCKLNSVEDSSENGSRSNTSQMIADRRLIGYKREMPIRITFDTKRLFEKPIVLEDDELEVKKEMTEMKVMGGEEAHEETEESEDSLDLSDISWEDVCRILDLFFFLGFIGIQCAFSIFFLVPLGSRA